MSPITSAKRTSPCRLSDPQPCGSSRTCVYGLRQSLHAAPDPRLGSACADVADTSKELSSPTAQTACTERTSTVTVPPVMVAPARK